MEPAFSTPQKAAGFALLVIGLLLLPAFVGRSGVLDRSRVYSTFPTNTGPFDYIQKQVFEEKSDLDVAFVGSSFIWVAIDGPYVEQQLGAALGRKAQVTTLASVWPGLDRDYFLVRDLLAHRKVKLLVLNLPNRELPTDDPDVAINRVTATPHLQAFRFYREGETPEIVQNLPLESRASLYAGAVLGMPRHLLSLARPDFPAPFNQLETDRGARKIKRGYFGEPYVEYKPPAPVLAPETMISSRAPAETFRTFDEPVPAFQQHFVRLLGKLAKEKGVPIVLLHIPHASERKADAVEERMDWLKLLGTPATLVGIPPAKLFAGLSDAEIKRFYSSDHLNDNGNAYFTRAITPALLKIYLEHETQP